MAGLDVTMGTVHLGPVNTLFLACGVLFTLAALLTARTLRVAAAHPECGGRLPADESPEDLPSRLAHRSPGSPALADERTTPPARR
jgi:hypothetical protein